MAYQSAYTGTQIDDAVRRVLTGEAVGPAGPAGANGKDGEPAGFGTISAKVNNTTGTPSVTVSESGPNTAKNISFTFDGIKGQPGENGKDGTPGTPGKNGENGISPTVSTTTTSEGTTVIIKDATGEHKFTVYNGKDGGGSSIDIPVTVENGGTGLTSIPSGNALIGAGTKNIETRAITDNTSTFSPITANNNLITANTLRFHTNRTSSVEQADTSYNTFMARGIAAGTSAPLTLIDGCIYLVYEE